MSHVKLPHVTLERLEPTPGVANEVSIKLGDTAVGSMEFGVRNPDYKIINVDNVYVMEQFRGLGIAPAAYLAVMTTVHAPEGVPFAEAGYDLRRSPRDELTTDGQRMWRGFEKKGLTVPGHPYLLDHNAPVEFHHIQ